jgi:serine/threonine protein kinase
VTQNLKIYSSEIMVRNPFVQLMCGLGYLLVADFGLAKFMTGSEMAKSFCGTAEYLAPAMLIGNGHDTTVD